MFQKKDTKKITAIMCVKNEEYYLQGFIEHIYPYVDMIVAVDDGSTDNTVKILKSFDKTVKVLELPYHDSKDWNEANNRLKVIELAKEVGSDWVLCCDPDERFETAFLKKLRKLASTSRKICYSVHFRELWGHYLQYRKDGIWNKKQKGIFFPLSDNMTFNYNQNHHINWYYNEIEKVVKLDFNLYHLKMIKEEHRIQRRDLYNKLDPQKQMQKIGYDYLTETKGLKLQKLHFWKKYNTTTISKELKEYKENDSLF